MNRKGLDNEGKPVLSSEQHLLGDHKKNESLATNLPRMCNKPNMASVMLGEPFDLSKHLAHILCFSSVTKKELPPYSEPYNKQQKAKREGQRK